jgi:hypothetical protein
MMKNERDTAEPVDLHAVAAESALVAAIAAVRKNPKALIKRLEERLEHFKGKDYYPPERGGKVAVATKEGTAAVHDAITYVSELRALPDLHEPVDLIARRARARSSLGGRGPSR